MRYKCTMHDYRENRKIAFLAKLLEQSWVVIFDSEDVESTSRYLQSTLRDLMNENFPAKTVRMSTRDPLWMTPLAKALLKKKAKAKCRCPDGCPISLEERINAIVAENHKSLASGKKGSKAWWEKVDALSTRKGRSNPSFDEDSVKELKIQREFLQAFDSNDNRAVRLFTMDVSKAVDRVKHNLLIEKLTQSPLNPYIANRYVSFLSDRKQSEWSVIILFVIGRMSTVVLLSEASAARICLTSS